MSDTSEGELHDRLAILDDDVAALGPGDGVAMADVPLEGTISEQMSQIVDLPGGAATLVARYGADERVRVIRPLAFHLAVAVNDRARAHTLAATVFALIDRLRTTDPWPRLNLCTAVQRLMMFEAALSSPNTPTSPALPRFLCESLDGPPALRATAATVVADLFYGRHTTAIPAAALDELRARVLALKDDPDELTRKEARGLDEFLKQAAV